MYGGLSNAELQGAESLVSRTSTYSVALPDDANVSKTGTLWPNQPDQTMLFFNRSKSREGCGRQGDGEMGRFVQIAMGSASELEYHLLLARDLKLLASPDHELLQSSLTGIRKMLAALLQVIIESKEKRPPRSKLTAKS